MKEISLSQMKSAINANIKEDPNKIKTRGKKMLDDDYVEKAFSALDDCIERTKRESLAYAKMRDTVNKDIEIKSQYMSEEELQKEVITANMKLYNNIYGVLDENVAEDGSSVKTEGRDINTLDIVNYGRNIDSQSNNTQVQKSNMQTETIYEYDEED